MCFVRFGFGDMKRRPFALRMYIYIYVCVYIYILRTHTYFVCIDICLSVSFLGCIALPNAPFQTMEESGLERYQ